MAAHILTGVVQTIKMLNDNPTAARPQIEAALNLSCWTEDDPSEWSSYEGVWHYLRRWLDGEYSVDQIINYLNYARMRLHDIWEAYGKPTTREAWLCARWPDLDQCKYYLEEDNATQYYEDVPAFRSRVRQYKKQKRARS